MLSHCTGQRLRMGRAAGVVDVEAVRLIADGDDVGAQLVKDMRGDVIVGAVGAIDHQPEAAQVHVVGKGALAKLDIAAGGIVDPLDLAQTLGGCSPHRPVEGGFNGQLGLVWQLGAGGGEELDAVVVIGIVRGGDDYADLQTQGAGQVGDARGRQRPGQANIDAGGSKAGFERRFEHVAGDPGVLADQHRRPLAVQGFMLGGDQHLAGGITQAHGKIRGDGRIAHLAAHAVGAEIFSTHQGPILSLVGRLRPTVGLKPTLHFRGLPDL